MRLKDKVAIVTGGGQGIGKGISTRFAQEGAKIVVTQRTASRAEKLASQLVDSGHDAMAVGCDISQREQVRTLLKATLDRYGRVDILVNNASLTGAPAIAGFLEETDDHWHNVIDVNLTGTWICSQEVARQLVKQGNGGRILHIASIDGMMAEEKAVAYCAAKAGVRMLTKSMALELARHNITVNCIAPGYIPHVEESDSQELECYEIYDRQPLRRRGTPQDIAAGAVYLVSDEAPFATGSTLIIDGGQLCYYFRQSK